MWKATFALIRASFTRDMMYRTNFWTAVFSRLGFIIFTLFWYDIMYSSILSVKGWDYAHGLFFLATFQLIETLTVAFFSSSFDSWHQHINYGTLDTMLIKPVDTQLILSLNAISFPHLLTILAPLTLLIIVSIQNHFFLSLTSIIAFAVGICLAVIVFYSVWLILMTFLFWLIGIQHWPRIFNSLTGLLQVPPVIYEGTIKFVFYFVIPIFAAVMLPLQIAWENSLIPLGWLAVAACVLFLIARYFFYFGLRFYSSASS
ncbi:MAG: hypothetical protein A2V81_01355 [Candidatus Abawacabacteria bacterium RBG_16_42_10]|uniref:ABC transporter permease n=1 Tax=Candidatus Abawacabacteria bacterium RBG_16_42_10 TaxID=1817814 RepID=A0A1F4XLP1_9BACT|nr:MAG: hypothetical protein A2V81_01355 [Candidatus Abawacabacteria bacterium RBG_16_42_10]